MTPETVVAAYQEVARPIMLDFMGGDRQTCIAATRITIETMRAFGLAAEPVSVKFVLHCPALGFAYISGFSAQERKRMARRNGKPIQNRGVGGYNGHLIAAVAGQWLIDPTIDQAESIEHGLRIEPTILVMPLPGDIKLKSMHATLKGTVDSGHEIEIGYRSRRDRSFETAEAWEFCLGMRFVVAQIVGAMDNVLKASTV